MFAVVMWKYAQIFKGCELFCKVLDVDESVVQFPTFPDCSLWILVSHTFFTNRRLLIWFLITLMSKEEETEEPSNRCNLANIIFIHLFT